jgi:hypothetical protein
MLFYSFFIHWIIFYCVEFFVFTPVCFIRGVHVLSIFFCIHLRILVSNAISISHEVMSLNSSTTSVTSRAVNVNASWTRGFNLGFVWSLCCSIFSCCLLLLFCVYCSVLYVCFPFVPFLLDVVLSYGFWLLLLVSSKIK